MNTPKYMYTYIQEKMYVWVNNLILQRFKGIFCGLINHRETDTNFGMG